LDSSTHVDAVSVHAELAGWAVLQQVYALRGDNPDGEGNEDDQTDYFLHDVNKQLFVKTII
jgi:hypothetical protein